MKTKLSILDLVNYPEGKTIADAFKRSKDLAIHAERLGYHRFWMAEHHNLNGIASSATPVLIGYIAENTKKIRVGSGGIMLPNHAPLVVAEQFGTLATLYPDRIDLGLGRAPGTDPTTTRALRRDPRGGEDFADLIEELEFFFAPAKESQKVRAIPGAGIDVPLWILGSSLYSAHLAARLGRPYSFASHFAPAYLMQALEVYRREFRSSKHLDKPYVMIGVPVVASDTDEKAEYLATSIYQRFVSLVRGSLRQTPAPVTTMAGLWSEAEEAQAKNMTRLMVCGGPEKIKREISSIVEMTGADELIVTSDLYSDEDRIRSFEILMNSTN